MATKVGIITEGLIDESLLPPLLSAIATERAEVRWPVACEGVADFLPVRKHGHGGVMDAVRRLVTALDSMGGIAPFDHAGYVILLDRKTERVREEVRRLIAGRDRFMLAIAKEEIEAWWLADRRNTLAWTGLEVLPATLRYAAKGYRAEGDDDPKRTLDELTRESPRIDRCYGTGNLDLAREFAETHWAEGCVRIEEIRSQCAEGFGRFDDDAANLFRRIKAAG